MEKSSLWEFNWVITSSQNFPTYTALSTTNFVTLFLSKIFHEKTIFFSKLSFFLFGQALISITCWKPGLCTMFIFFLSKISLVMIIVQVIVLLCFPFLFELYVFCYSFKFGNIWKKQLWMCSIKKEVLQIFSKFLAKHLGISVRISF